MNLIRPNSERQNRQPGALKAASEFAKILSAEQRCWRTSPATAAQPLSGDRPAGGPSSAAAEVGVRRSGNFATKPKKLVISMGIWAGATISFGLKMG